MIKVVKNSNVRCQWCTLGSNADDWNTETYNECKSREMKRAFKAIFDMSVWKKDSQYFYKCPRCGMWSRGSQLLLIGDNGEPIRGIGGESIIKVVKQEND